MPLANTVLRGILPFEKLQADCAMARCGVGRSGAGVSQSPKTARKLGAADAAVIRGT